LLTNAHPAISTPITPICPICLLENETNDHFLTCNHDTYRIAWKEDVAAWYEHSKEINLEPILTFYILQVLMDCESFVRQTDIDFCDDKYKKLCREQH
jgi:hypothetical protein